MFRFSQIRRPPGLSKSIASSTVYRARGQPPVVAHLLLVISDQDELQQSAEILLQWQHLAQRSEDSGNIWGGSPSPAICARSEVCTDRSRVTYTLNF